MRILHVSTRLILGGSQENTVLSCEGQARLGHEVHLAFGPIYGPEGSLLDRVTNFRTPDGRGITTHVVPDLVRAIHPFHDWRAKGQLKRLIRRLNPDIVHTHSSKAGILGRAAAWAVGGCGVVHTIHGPPFHGHQNAITRRAYIVSERWAARRCHRIVSVADAMTRQYLAAGIGRAEQYTTIYSGMETERCLNPEPGQTRDQARADLGFGGEHYVIGTVARLAELKGHDDLLDALGDDLKANPRWRLLWVGDGWWRERLEKRVDSLGLRGRIVITGLVPPERIPALMRAMDVLVHPSYREGLPRTVPQALLCGTPVVAYDADGTGEACIDRVTGRLVNVGDRAGLREAIEWTVANTDEARLLAQAGRDLCRERFSAAHMIDALQAVYSLAHALASRPC